MALSDEESLTPGELLCQAREASGISQREMADRLNWMPSYIVAVEENRFEVLRSRAFARGYICSYGKLLGLSEESLLQAFDQHCAVELPAEETPSLETPRPQLQKSGYGILIGLGAVLCLIVLMWWLQGDEADSGDAHPASKTAAVQSGSAGFAASDRVAGETAAATVSDPVPAALAIAEPGPEFADTVPDRVTSANRNVESADALDPGTALVSRAVGAQATEVVDRDLAEGTAGARLDFRFSGDCWLEIRNGNDRLIYAELRHAGESLTVRGIAPFSVLMGDARYVLLHYQGEEVAIKTRPGRNTARIDVGES